MSTNITVKESKRSQCRFEDLEKGEYFIHNQRLMVKVTECTIVNYTYTNPSSPFTWNAIRLGPIKPGSRSRISEGTFVKRVDEIEFSIVIDE